MAPIPSPHSHPQLAERPSPFDEPSLDPPSAEASQPMRSTGASGGGEPTAAAAAAAADDLSPAIAPPSAASLAQSKRMAWEQALEDGMDAPAIAATFSTALPFLASIRQASLLQMGPSSLALAGAEPQLSFLQRQVSLLPEEAASLKVAEAGGGWTAWRGEAARVLALAVPLAVANLAGFCINAVGVSFVGRLGGLQLSAAVLAASVFNVTGQSVMMGFCGTIDTLAGQAFGARNYKAVGVVLQRALLVNLVFGGAIALAWLRSERLFLALGQEAELSAAAARYMVLVAPSLPCIGTFEALKRILIVQGVVRPATIVTMLAAALAPLYNWLLISRLDLGLAGAALAVVALQATCVALLGSYVAARCIRHRGRPDSIWGGWSGAAFRGWGRYLSLALPSCIMICCKWWSFEALLLMAGWTPRAQLDVAAMGICSVTNSIIFMLVFGLSIASSVRVSNSLGAGCPQAARRAIISSFAATLALLAAFVGMLLVLQDRWVRLLTDVEPVVEATVKLLPVFCLSLLGDNTNVALQALLRGAGKQKIGALTNIFSYWVLAIPLAHYLAFTRGMGLQGLWWGTAAANCAMALFMLVVVLRFDYEGEAARSAARYGTLRQPLLQADAHA